MPSASQHIGLAVGRILKWNQNKSKSGRLENLAPEWLQNTSKTLSCNHNVGMEFLLELQSKPFVWSEWPLHNFVFGIRLQNLWSWKQGRRQNLCWKDLKGSGGKIVGSFLSMQTLHSPSNCSEQIKGKKTQHMDPNPTNCWDTASGSTTENKPPSCQVEQSLCQQESHAPTVAQQMYLN